MSRERWTSENDYAEIGAHVIDLTCVTPPAQPDRDAPAETGGATFSEFTEAFAAADDAYRAVLEERVETFSRCTDIICGATARTCAETGPCCEDCCHPRVTPAQPSEPDREA